MPEFFDISHIISAYGYFGIFLIVFLESGIFFPLPGDSLLFAAGLFAATGGLNVYLLESLVFTASFLGIVSGYHIGWHLLKLQNAPVFRKILKPEYIARAHDFFSRHGRYTIILSRFVPVVRTFVPITAGAAKMNYFSFIRYSLLGSLVWSGIIVFGGFFLGKVFPKTEEYLLLIVILIVVVSLLPGVFELMKKRKTK